MPTKKQIQNMLEQMNVTDLRILSKYFDVPVTKQLGGYRNRNDLVKDLVGGTFDLLRRARRRMRGKTNVAVPEGNEWLARNHTNTTILNLHIRTSDFLKPREKEEINWLVVDC